MKHILITTAVMASIGGYSFYIGLVKSQAYAVSSPVKQMQNHATTPYISGKNTKPLLPEGSEFQRQLVLLGLEVDSLSKTVDSLKAEQFQKKQQEALKHSSSNGTERPAITISNSVKLPLARLTTANA